MKKLLLTLLLLCIAATAQQPQTGTPDPQALQGVNAKWANGVGPGYWPYQKTGVCTGLNICISPGTVAQCMGTSHVAYAGTTAFALTNNATNYLYLDLDNNCIPAVNTTGYSNRNIAIAKITTVTGAITSLLDDRTWNGSHVVLGAVNNQTGTTYTINATDRGKLVTASNAASQTYTLPTTLGVTFAFGFANIGTGVGAGGTVALTPASGNICSNGCTASLTVAVGSGGWLFYDGTEWNAVMGGGGGSGTVGGVLIKTAGYTFASADSSKLIVMNCSSACQLTFNGSPTATDYGWIISIGSTLATISLNSKNYNGASAVPVLTNDMAMSYFSDGTNYYGDPPLVVGTGLIFTGATNGVTIAMTTAQTRRTCAILIGADNSTVVLANADIAPQGRQCFVPHTATVVEIEVAADGGTPSVVPAVNHAGALSDLVSSALATAGSGGIACSKTSATTGLDGATTCSATLQNTSVAAGDYLETHTATAGGTAKRMSIFITYTVN